MGILVLVPWGQTAWSVADRLTGHTPLPLTDTGRRDVQTSAGQLAQLGISTIYSSNEATSLETAALLHAGTGAGHKTVDKLVELDVGLWDGLTSEELKQRYSKAFKKWFNDPTSACPPEGEDGMQAFERIAGVLDPILRKLRNRRVAIVLAPLAAALMRCRLESVDAGQLRSLMLDEPVVYEIGDDGRISRGVLLSIYVPITDADAGVTPASHH